MIKKEEIIKLMKEGWELGTSNAMRSYHIWIQKDGLCKGGESKSIHKSTLHSLIDKKLVILEPRKHDDAFWLTRYKLNPEETWK